MAWIKPKGYKKSEIDHAGDVLISGQAQPEEIEQAIVVLDNWRACHSYPMHVFKIRLKNSALAVDPKALTAQRLKRVPAILKKLARSYHGRRPSMQLSQMQDIGGCRAILSNVVFARKLCDEHYLKGDLKHKRVGLKDYIAAPKEDGYRGIHLIYKYASDKGKAEFNDLLVEIQIRSKLQHLWATAVETVGFFTRQAIKSSEGSPEWTDFFRLVSAALAKMENCPPVSNTPSDERELYLEIKKKESELNVVSEMSSWTNAIKIFRNTVKHSPKFQNFQYFLLELDITGERLNITGYTRQQEQKAISEYDEAEKRYRGKKEYDVVLVGSESADLEKAYPNYFVDTQEFISILKKIVTKYS
ncbi:MAG: RelA/SpoT domain-containing protein [Candidatus Micrarchaeota archaeon]